MNTCNAGIKEQKGEKKKYKYIYIYKRFHIHVIKCE